MERRGLETFLTPALPLQLLSTPSCFFRLEKEAGQGCPGEEGEEEGAGGSFAGCGRPVGRVQAPAPSFPADADSPAQPGRVVLGALGSGSSLALALLPDPASNVGRALQKELGGLPSLAKLSPKMEERSSLSPPKSWPSPTCPSCFPTWEMGERTRNSICDVRGGVWGSPLSLSSQHWRSRASLLSCTGPPSPSSRAP